jgi:hypothetical protein
LQIYDIPDTYIDKTKTYLLVIEKKRHQRVFYVDDDPFLNDRCKYELIQFGEAHKTEEPPSECGVERFVFEISWKSQHIECRYFGDELMVLYSFCPFEGRIKTYAKYMTCSMCSTQCCADCIGVYYPVLCENCAQR